MKCENKNVLDAVIKEVIKHERYRAFSEDDIISVMHGLARTDHGKDVDVFKDFGKFPSISIISTPEL